MRRLYANAEAGYSDNCRPAIMPVGKRVKFGVKWCQSLSFGSGLVELSLNYGGYAYCGNSLDKATPRQCQTRISFWCAHDWITVDQWIPTNR